jgi:hypothetical protein
MKSIRTIVLVAFALILGLWAFYGERHLEEQNPGYDNRLGRFTFGDLDTVTIESALGTIIGVHQHDTTWQIVYPHNWLGDSYRWESLVRDISASRRDREWLSPPDSLRYYTLEYPNATLRYTFKDHNTPPETLHIGGQSPKKDRGYVRFGTSDSVILTNIAVHKSASKSYFEMRDKKFFETFVPDDVDTVDINTSGDHLRIARNGARWRMLSPLERWADPDTVGQMLERISTLRVQQYVDNPEAALDEFGLGESSIAKLTFSSGDSSVPTETDQLILGSLVSDPRGGYVGVWGMDAARKSTVLGLPLELLPELDRSASSFWDRRMAIYERRLIDSVVVITKDETITVSQDRMGDWHMTSPRVQPAYRPRVNRIVADAERARLLAFAGRSSEIENPELQLKFYHGDDIQGELTFGAAAGELVIASGSAVGEQVFVSLSLFDLLNAPSSEFDVPEAPERPSAR